MKASSRLSFISYTDLLTSAPISAQPLSAVLAPGSVEPPTHVVVVDPTDNTVNSTNSAAGSGIGSLNVYGNDKQDIDSLGTVGLSGAGEWGREGLGGGLEERLERLWAAEREISDNAEKERGRSTIKLPKAAE